MEATTLVPPKKTEHDPLVKTRAGVAALPTRPFKLCVLSDFELGEAAYQYYDTTLLPRLYAIPGLQLLDIASPEGEVPTEQFLKEMTQEKALAVLSERARKAFDHRNQVITVADLVVVFLAQTEPCMHMTTAYSLGLVAAKGKPCIACRGFPYDSGVPALDDGITLSCIDVVQDIQKLGPRILEFMKERGHL